MSSHLRTPPMSGRSRLAVSPPCLPSPEFPFASLYLPTSPLYDSLVTPRSSSKRKSTAQISPPTPTKTPKIVKRHPVHWYDDGNMMLQIGTTRFKVHRRRLADECGWFKSLSDVFTDSKTPDIRMTVKEIEDVCKIVASRETVVNIPLFHLDGVQGMPNADEFAALLTAMNNGIEYAYNPPDLEHIAHLYKAISFFRAPRYRSFVEKYLDMRFPDDFTSLDPNPSVEEAELGVVLGRRYDRPKILTKAFYDLVRTRPDALLNDEVDEDSDEYTDDSDPDQLSKKNPTNDDDDSDEYSDDMDEGEDERPKKEHVNKPADDIPSPPPLPLARLDPRDLVCLLRIQKYLALAWDKIYAILAHTCTRDTCTRAHRPTTKVAAIKAQYPFDPILGIMALVDDDLIWRPSAYCCEAKIEVQEQLLARREVIWRGLKRLIAQQVGERD